MLDFNGIKMEIKQTTDQNINIISSYTSSSITVGNNKHVKSISLSRNTINHLNICKITELDISLLPEISKYEIIIFGTGSHTEKLTGKQLSYLAKIKTSYEFMRTESAIKTYNTLAHDNREVIAILLIN